MLGSCNVIRFSFNYKPLTTLYRGKRNGADTELTVIQEIIEHAYGCACESFQVEHLGVSDPLRLNGC